MLKSAPHDAHDDTAGWMFNPEEGHADASRACQPRLSASDDEVGSLRGTADESNVDDDFYLASWEQTFGNQYWGYKRLVARRERRVARMKSAYVGPVTTGIAIVTAAAFLIDHCPKLLRWIVRKLPRRKKRVQLADGMEDWQQGDLRSKLSLRPSQVDRGQWWRLLTVTLTHANMLHLANNCAALLALGGDVHAACGGVRFLALYLGGAAMGSWTSYHFHPPPEFGDTWCEEYESVGASGAICGLLGAQFVLPLLDDSYSLVETKPVLVAVAQAVAHTMLQRSIGINIDHAGHVGGLVGGAVLMLLLRRK